MLSLSACVIAELCTRTEGRPPSFDSVSGWPGQEDNLQLERVPTAVLYNSEGNVSDFFIVQLTHSDVWRTRTASRVRR